MSIKIAITDDHPMIIGGVRNMLANYPHIQLIGTYTDGAELLEGLTKEVPDVLLLDIQLPEKTGDELTPILQKMYPDMHILMLTNFNSPIYANNMLRLGISGYLLKTAREYTMIEAIETVMKGEIFIDPALREKLDALDRKARNAVFNKVTLTPREKDILKLILQGKTSQEIVSELFLSIYTVKNYRNRILLKLDVKNMAELAGKALAMGLMDTE